MTTTHKRLGKTREKLKRAKASNDDAMVAFWKKEIEALDSQRLKERGDRAIKRVNDHTTQQADRLKDIVEAEGKATRDAIKPLTDLVSENGDEATQIKGKENKIALLRAEVREIRDKKRLDQKAKALEREKAKQDKAKRETLEAPSKRHRPTVALPQEIAPLLERCYHDEFVQEPERTEIWKCLTELEPYVVKWGRFKTPVRSRPKINFGIANEFGEYPLYSWGQAVADYSRIQPMPSPVRALGARIEEAFGHQPGYLNQALATFYWNRRDQHIPQHQDKAVDKMSGKIESNSNIYNVAFGAVRPFIFTTLAALGKTLGKDKEIDSHIVKEFPMTAGSLIVLSPTLNTALAHGVPKDSSITDLRISLVFRHCDRNWVKPGQYCVCY